MGGREGGREGSREFSKREQEYSVRWRNRYSVIFRFVRLLLKYCRKLFACMLFSSEQGPMRAKIIAELIPEKHKTVT